MQHSSLRAWLPTFPWLVVIGFIFWFGALSTFNLGIDQEAAIFRSDERIWISQGRWVIFFLTQYIYTQPVIGYFPHLLFVLLSAGAYLLLVDAFGLRIQQRNWVLLAAGLFIAHPVWVFITEFYTNLVPTALGILSCSVALWCFSQREKEQVINRWVGAIAQVGLIFFALGNYQAFILVMVVLYTAYLANAYAHGSLSVTQLWRKGLLAVSYMVLALGLQMLFLQLLYRIYGVTHDPYISQLMNSAVLSADPLGTLKSVYEGAQAMYMGQAAMYGSSVFFVGSSLLLGALLFMYKAIQQRRVAMSLVLLTLVFISPFLLHIMAGGFWRMPLRAGLAVPFVVVFLALYALFNARQPWLKGLIIASLVLGNIQLLHLQARYSSAKQLTLEYDRRVASQLFERITTVVPNFSLKHSYEFSVQGGMPYHSPYGGVATTAITGSFFWWDNGSASRIANYMRVLNLGHFTPISAEQQDTLAPIYTTMPLWPAQGSVREHEGIILVRFGDLSR